MVITMTIVILDAMKMQGAIQKKEDFNSKMQKKRILEMIGYHYYSLLHAKLEKIEKVQSEILHVLFVSRRDSLIAEFYINLGGVDLGMPGNLLGCWDAPSGVPASEVLTEGRNVCVAHDVHRKLQTTINLNKGP